MESLPCNHSYINLGISQANEYNVNSDYVLDPINAIIIKYSEHPNILKIKEIASWHFQTLQY